MNIQPHIKATEAHIYSRRDTLSERKDFTLSDVLVGTMDGLSGESSGKRLLKVDKRLLDLPERHDVSRYLIYRLFRDYGFPKDYTIEGVATAICVYLASFKKLTATKNYGKHDAPKPNNPVKFLNDPSTGGNDIESKLEIKLTEAAV